MLKLLLRVWLTYLIFIFILLLPPSVFLIEKVVQSDAPLAGDGLRIVWLGESSATPFTPTETAHLQDVHRLVMVFFLISLPALIWGRKGVRSKHLYMASAVSLVLSIAAAGAFDRFFELFHQVFFPQGNYAFPADSLLIRTYPPQFWLVAFVVLQLGVSVTLFLQAAIFDILHPQPCQVTQVVNEDRL